jgi:tRNA 2-selenouridine synthase SelU
VDFLWNYLRDLNNQSCQIILKKFEKYNSKDDLPLKIFVQNLNTYTSIKVGKTKTIREILQEQFKNAFENETLKSQFSSKFTKTTKK